MRISLTELLPLLGAGALVLLNLFWSKVLLPLLFRLVGDWLWKRSVKTEAHAIAWWHYKFRKLRLGHQTPSVHDCNEGACAQVRVS